MRAPDMTMEQLFAASRLASRLAGEIGVPEAAELLVGLADLALFEGTVLLLGGDREAAEKLRRGLAAREGN